MLFLEKLEQSRVYIISIILICILLGVVYSICFIPKEYVASTTMLLLDIEKDADEKTKATGNLELSKSIVATLEEIIKSESTIQRVKQDLNLEIENKELNKKIEVKRISDSDTLRIRVRNTDSEIASQIAEEIVDIFSEKIKETFGNTEIYLVDTAHIVEEKQSFPIAGVIGLSIVVGISLSVIYIIISLRIDKNIKTSGDIESELLLKNLISIPLNTKRLNKGKINSELVLYTNQKSLVSKAFRELRSNIKFININSKEKEKDIILITSPRKGEGKSYIASNMAISFAEVGKKVVLIDADMNNGRLGKIFNIPNNLGISNYLSNLDTNGIEINELINKYINETEVKNLNVITSGTKPPNSAELLTLPKLQEMIKDLSIFYDVVIIDGTPALTTVDSLILTRVANSTIIVSDYKKTKKDDLWKTKRDIQNVGGRIAGVIINKVRIREKIVESIDLRNIITNIVNGLIFAGSKIKIVCIKIAEICIWIVNKVKELIKEFKNRRNHKFLPVGEEVLGGREINQILQVNMNTESNQSGVASVVSEEVSVKAEINSVLNEGPGVSSIVKVKEENNEQLKLKLDDVSKENKIEIISENINQEKTAVVKEQITTKQENIQNEEIPVIETKPMFEVYENKELNNFRAQSMMVLNNAKNNIVEFAKKIKQTAGGKFEKIRKDTFENQEEYNEEKYALEKGEDTVIEEYTLNKKIQNRKINDTDSIKEIQKAITNNKIANEKAINGEYELSEETILVIVTPDNGGLCRAFNKYCFTEKLVRGVDKVDGFVKAHYSAYLLNKRIEGLMFLYGISRKQAKRVDTLVYTTLSDYDDCVWLERKMASNKAEIYARCMTKDYDRLPGEKRIDYVVRCQELRRLELRRNDIELEYQLNNLWQSNEMKFSDKVVMNRFANSYEVKLKSKTLQNMYRATYTNNFINGNKIENNHQSENISLKYEEDDIRTIAKNNKNKFKDYFDNVSIDQVKIKSVEELEQEVINKNNSRSLESFAEQQRAEKVAKKKQIQDQKKLEKVEKKKLREASKRNKELEKERQREEARIEEELLGDNLYPKTKFNKDL